MKLLSAAVSALVVLGLAGAVAAQCSGYLAAQSAEAPVVVIPDGSAGS